MSGDHNTGLPGLDEGADFQCSGPLVCFAFRRFGVHVELAQLAIPCSVDRSPALTLSRTPWGVTQGSETAFVFSAFGVLS